MAMLIASIPSAMVHAQAGPDAMLAERVARLERDNQLLRETLMSMQAHNPSTLVQNPQDENTQGYNTQDDNSQCQAVVTGSHAPAPARASGTIDATQPAARTHLRGRIDVDQSYGFAVLDHTQNTTERQRLQLSARANGQLGEVLTVSGQVTVLANSQRSSAPSKFGYLMRNPTSANQIGDSVSEAVVHSANLAFTANISPSIMAYAELLYAPQQSLGSGTITALSRNQIEARRAYVLFGDLTRSPVYAAIGKMDVPFGLNDTVSPFTNSTNWHAFAALAYGAKIGYAGDNWHIQAMAVQGGAQFRSANVEVAGTNVPSQLSNFAIDADRRFVLGEDFEVNVGASYIYGSAYCQAYPVTHFAGCQDNNPAWAAYGKATYGGVTLIAEYAETTKIWPGTAVPDPSNPLSEFEAVKASAYTLGASYGFGRYLGRHRRHSVSLEYSKFISGDSGAPWERQDQLVAGYSAMMNENAKLFAEYIRVNGFAPLNFLSGGNLPNGQTWSERDAETEVFLVGAQVAF